MGQARRMTGTASRIIHSGRFSEVMNASTFSRLIALLLLALRGADDLAQRLRLRVEVEVLEQVADRLCAHAALEVDAEAVRRAEAVLQLPEQHLVVDDQLRLELPEELPRLLEAGDRVDRRLARRHAGTRCPGTSRGQAPTARGRRSPPSSLLAQAEVVGELLDAAGRPRLGLVEDVPEQPVAEARAPSRGSSRRRRRRAPRLRPRAPRPPKRVAHLVHVLRDRALLGAGRLVGLLGQRRRAPRGSGPRRCRPPPCPAGASRRSSRTAVERTSSRIFFESSVVTVFATSAKMPRQGAPPRRWAGPAPRPRPSGADLELVVLVEVALLALREVVAPAREPVLERAERLVASTLMRSYSPRTLSSRSFRSAARSRPRPA